MRITVKKTGVLLSQLLSGEGHPLDFRCGGRGVCGRCDVFLLSGTWSIDGKIVKAPCRALACRSQLAGDLGEIEFTPPAKTGKTAFLLNTFPLPSTQETVIAIDIGTTTLAVAKIREGELIAQAGCFNRQDRYGDNVISRINAAAFDLKGLQMAILDPLRELLAEVGVEDAARIAVAGNTVMSCLLHGIDPTSIGSAPFTPPLRTFPIRNDLFGAIPILTMPCIAGYVGGDLTAGLSETRLQPGEMLIDIGTNCEIILNTPNGLFCTAAAAGPTFEGAGLHFGRRATEGAIDRYFEDGTFSVLGGGTPNGLCGSAFVDFLAVERRSGHLTPVGRYEPKAQQKNITDSIFVHEYDIEQLLKAKAAVYAGIKTLEEHCHTRAEKIYLAGGFAQFLNLENAVSAGMLPAGRAYEIAGNLCLGGAARLAVQPESLAELEKLIDLPQELSLGALPNFEDNFIDGLLLP